MNEQGTPSYVIYLGIFVTVFIIALGVFLWTTQSKTKEISLTETNNYQQEETQQEESPKAEQKQAETEELKVTIASPENNAIITTETTKIAGATKPGTTIAITGGAQDTINETNADGSFALDVTLKDGENNLEITVFDQNGQQKTVKKTLFYLVEG